MSAFDRARAAKDIHPIAKAAIVIVVVLAFGWVVARVSTMLAGPRLSPHDECRDFCAPAKVADFTVGPGGHLENCRCEWRQ